MKILRINACQGPNYWSIQRPNLIVMLLDIGELELTPTNEIPGFYQRITKMFPGLYEHRCSEGVPGGFLNRIKRGTWMAHVVEHIAIELQVMAGLEASFGQARGTGVEGQYHVIFDYTDPETGVLVAETAVSITEDLLAKRARNVKKDIQEIKESTLRHMPGPSTSAILQEARKRNIPYIKLEDSLSYQLGYGCFQKRIEATIACTTSNIAVELACNKEACKELLGSMGIPVAMGSVISSENDLKKTVHEIGYPLVIKPINGNHGRGVTTNIQDAHSALKAYTSASAISHRVIVEKYVPGCDFRLLVINYKLVAAAKRTPAHVIGNGHSSIQKLINLVNLDPRRGEGHNKVLTRIDIDSATREILKFKGYTLDTILPEREILYLNHAANLSTGGTAEDITDKLHPEVAAMAERVARLVGLDICGIDIMAPCLEQPLSKTGGVVLEVNAAPGFRMHLAPSGGKPRNVASPMLDMLFPKGTQSRIPIIAITGTNGKTTTTRLIAHIMKISGRKVGLTTTDGVYINDQLMLKGDCTGPKSAEFILKDPTVDMAVLECARGGILRSGLGFDSCDVGLVTNVASDHLGMRGIDTLEKMARLKSVIPESVNPMGYAVLNADDDLVYSMRESISCRAILFSMDAQNPRMLAHRQDGGIGVVLQNDYITIWDGSNEYQVERADYIPLTFEGTAGFMIENILGAVAVAYSQNVQISDMQKALLGFLPSPEHTPGRMNRFRFNNFDVIIDYAHNPAGFRAIQQFLNNSSYLHKVGIVAAIGDRRLEDSLELGRLAAEIFDEVIIREDSDLRGKQPGELTEIIKAGIAQASDHHPMVKAIPNEKTALSYSIEKALPGSVIILCTEQVSEIITFTRQALARQQSSRPLVLQKSPGKRMQYGQLKTIG